MIDTFTLIFASIVVAATPLLLAAIGELVTEKSGVLNLGIEGMMLVGAVSGFATVVATGSTTLALLAAAGSGAGMALMFGILTLSLQANQVATGLALTIFGIGLSALLGQDFVGVAVERLPKLQIDGVPGFLSNLLFHDLLVYFSLFMVGAVWWFLNRSRAGLVLRAVGENHDAAHAIGYPVIAIRYLATLFGGAMSGVAGAYLSLAYTPMWAENMSAGRGWIALALVVFATWRPGRVLFGAYLFGGITIGQLHLQGLGISLPSQVLSMLPYLATILVLVLISRDEARIRINAPACIGKLFRPST
ncbi:ABC transporter permease [Rhodovibrionaceae bacterium A322]